MWRKWFQSLRLRLAVLTAAVVLTTVGAAVVLAWTLSVADGQVSELTSAQRRLEHLSAASSRVGDYALASLQTTESNELQTDRLSLPRKGIQEAFERFKLDVADEVVRRGALGSQIEASRGRALAFMKGSFDVLDRQVMVAIREGRGGDEAGRQAAEEKVRAALDQFASTFGPALSQAIESERIAARDADAAMAELRAGLARMSTIAVALAALFSLALYRWIASPLLSRISEVAGAARDIASGRTGTRLAVRGHDELSVLMTRFNRMAIHLSRKEARLVEGQRELQKTVDERTVELRRANERLSDIDRARRRFFTDVSHELRTPLTVILGEADVTLRGRPQTDDLRSALATIRVRAKALHRRVEDLLRVARSESGQLELNFAKVSLKDVVDLARDNVASAAAARRIALSVGMGEPEIVMEADADWLRQVIEGLISNALRHVAPGGTIRLEARADGEGFAEISVSDDGEGISDADLPHIFERFYRGRGQKEGAGFGIGLALARWVVERHGGVIHVESRTAGPGRAPGTTVAIRLPALTPRLAIGACS